MQRVTLAKEDLSSHRDEPVGRIVVGLPPSLARRLTLSLIDTFDREMPKAKLAVSEGFSVNIAEWLTTVAWTWAWSTRPSRSRTLK